MMHRRATPDHPHEHGIRTAMRRPGLAAQPLALDARGAGRLGRDGHLCRAAQRAGRRVALRQNPPRADVFPASIAACPGASIA